MAWCSRVVVGTSLNESLALHWVFSKGFGSNWPSQISVFACPKQTQALSGVSASDVLASFIHAFDYNETQIPGGTTVYPQGHYEALQAARQRQSTDAFRALYQERAGIEGTMSQGVRRMGMRQSRYIGLTRTHLQHVATAAATNVVRSVNWLMGEDSEPTRVPPFQALATI